ncbi:MAG: hypothetical protein GY719_26845 [bacterium]|nr:hypothetical protein [bacterium]
MKIASALERVAVLVPMLLAGCGTVPEFDYRRHQPPRVSVTHSPLVQGLGLPVELVARAEVAEGSDVAEVRITLTLPGRSATERVCEGTAECRMTVITGARQGLAVYRASVLDSEGRRGETGAAYTFWVGDPEAAVPLPLRVALDGDRDNRARRVDVLLVRDSDSYASDVQLWQDAERLIYRGLLADPTYRWRDHQLGFYYTFRPGITRDYHSGLQVRCGQDPWLTDPEREAAEDAAEFADVVAVLHRNPGYRDCSGLGAGAGGQTRFSADGASPEVFHHEFGHAFAGLSDEYFESTEDRRSRSDDAPASPWACICCDDGTDTPGDVGPPGGGIDPDPIDACHPDQPPCSETLPLECHTADPFCPPLGSTCAHSNVFPSRDDCEAAAVAAAAHPGVEVAAAAEDCRRLCGPGNCPCLPPGDPTEIWILDRREPPPAGSFLSDDLMGRHDLNTPRERHGPACQRCTEATFCRYWELGRGRTPVEADAHCL